MRLEDAFERRQGDAEGSEHSAGATGSGIAQERFAHSAVMLTAYERGEATKVATRQLGPALAFERLWQETGCRRVIGDLDLLRLTLDKLSISGRWWARFERWHYGGEACDAILVVVLLACSVLVQRG